MEKEYVEFKEVVELFVNAVVGKINSGEEIPKVNIVFPDEAFKLFQYVKENPFLKKGAWTPDIEDEDILKLRPENQQDQNCQTIYVREPVRFFELLTEFINSYVDYKSKYHIPMSGRAVLLHHFKCILLRMGVQDFLKPEEFLQKQIDFLKADVWDDYIVRDWFLKSARSVGEYGDIKILASKNEVPPYCETSEKMGFVLYDENGKKDDIHSLPCVYYGIREENGEMVGYIYAIQNPRDKVENKKIARKLYKLNKDVVNSNVHPGQVLVLKTFIEMLENLGITKIKVPLMQILSYGYHELLAKEALETLKKWTPEVLETLQKNPTWRNRRRLEEYEWDKLWATHVIDKKDFIEKAKTEGLYNIFYRVAEQFGSIEILNDPFIEDEYLNIRIKREKFLSKSK